MYPVIHEDPRNDITIEIESSNLNLRALCAMSLWIDAHKPKLWTRVHDDSLFSSVYLHARLARPLAGVLDFLPHPMNVHRCMGGRVGASVVEEQAIP